MPDRRTAAQAAAFLACTDNARAERLIAAHARLKAQDDAARASGLLPPSDPQVYFAWAIQPMTGDASVIRDCIVALRSDCYWHHTPAAHALLLKRMREARRRIARARRSA